MKLGLALIAVAFLLSGCLYYRMGDRWILTVWATPTDSDVDSIEPACPGALSATIDFGRGRTFTATASQEVEVDEVTFRHDGTVLAGQAVIVEAWCTDAAGAELGYSLLQGTVNRPMADSLVAMTSVSPGFEGDEELQGCMATLTRGLRPCISDWGNNIQPR